MDNENTSAPRLYQPLPPHGLTAYQNKIIRRVIRGFAPEMGEVKVFGSRGANGNYHEGSDLDLVVYSADSREVVDDLREAFAGAAIPIKVDVLGYEFIKEPRLIEHIDNAAIPLQLGT